MRPLARRRQHHSRRCRYSARQPHVAWEKQVYFDRDADRADGCASSADNLQQESGGAEVGEYPQTAAQPAWQSTDGSHRDCGSPAQHVSAGDGSDDAGDSAEAAEVGAAIGRGASCRCAAGAGNAWLEHEDFWSLAFTAGLDARDARWMNAFDSLCTEEGCDLNAGICGEVFVRLVMDELVVRCQRTGESLRTMLKLLRPTEAGDVPCQPRSCAQLRQPIAGRRYRDLEPVCEVGSASEGVDASLAAVAEISMVSVDEAFELARLAAQSAKDSSDSAESPKHPSCAVEVGHEEAVEGKETASAVASTAFQMAEPHAADVPKPLTKRARDAGRRNAEEERFLGELDKFKLTARAKPSPSSRCSIQPAPFDPLIELDTLAVPTVDQDWQTMLQDVFEMELQGSSTPCEQ